MFLYLFKQMALNPEVWGPHFWFMLHTMALTYPHHPNSVTKKKYYDFISNLPLFIPVADIGKDFERLLDKYPISSYLDSRTSFTKWMHFIHNKINEKLEKPKINMNDFYIKYYESYKKKEIKITEFYRWKKKLIYTLVVLCLLGFSIYLYYK